MISPLRSFPRHRYCISMISDYRKKNTEVGYIWSSRSTSQYRKQVLHTCSSVDLTGAGVILFLAIQGLLYADTSIVIISVPRKLS